ncbi:MAG: hypothetical protein R3B57_00825 [Phycisphaerales bacterium]
MPGKTPVTMANKRSVLKTAGDGGRVDEGQSERRTEDGRVTLAASAIVLASVLGFCVVWPIAQSIWHSFARAGSLEWSGVWSALAMSPMSVVRSLWAALLIGTLATALGWPAAWLLARGRGARWAPLVLTPMLVPSYLAYSGWGMLRDPGTFLGDMLSRAASDGARWAPLLAGKTFAVMGLALWASPLAALVLASGIARRDPAAEDALRLEPASFTRRVRTTLAMHRGAIAGSAALVSLVMLGSAVPLHLSQLDTLAVVVWRELAGSSRDLWWRSWVAATPLLVVALVAGWVIGGVLIRKGARDAPEGPREAPTPRSRIGSKLGTLGVWALGVGAPVALFAWGMRDPHSLMRFWRLSGDGAISSLEVAGIVGAICLVLALALSAALAVGGRGGRLVASIGVRVMLIAALIPGVLVGAAIAEATTSVGLDLGLTAPVMACVARGSFIVGIVACWAAWSEPPSLRDTRRQLGGGWRAWALGALPLQAPALLGGALASAALSLHEIEATVMVWPPGLDSLSRQTLEYLHFSRMEELSAAAIWITAVGLTLALLAGALIALASTRLRGAREGARA